MYPVVLQSSTEMCIMYKNFPDIYFFSSTYMSTYIHRTMWEWYMYSVSYIGKYIAVAMATVLLNILHVPAEFIIE